MILIILLTIMVRLKSHSATRDQSSISNFNVSSLQYIQQTRSGPSFVTNSAIYSHTHATHSFHRLYPFFYSLNIDASVVCPFARSVQSVLPQSVFSATNLFRPRGPTSFNVLNASSSTPPHTTVLSFSLDFYAYDFLTDA